MSTSAPRRSPSILCAGLAIVLSSPASQADAPEQPSFARTFPRHAVAADHPIASAAGAAILAKGGNAVDAAVAASFTLSVVRPFSCGIGGGGFMVIVLPARDGKPAVTTAINYRETCPAAVGPDLFEPLDDDAPRRAGKAVATPGTIAGLLYALDKYGTMKRADVLAPAIHAARDGFTADEAYAKAAKDTIAKFESPDHKDWKTRFAFTWERFLGSGKISLGDRIVLPEQARALELIARDGIDALTNGDLGKAICAAAAKADGLLTIGDLRNYRVSEVQPLRIDSGLLGRTLITMPPPSSGGVAMGETLGIMQRRDSTKLIAAGEWPQYTHVMIESFKHAFADRAEWMADPAFVDVPVERLLSDEYLLERSLSMFPTQAMAPEMYGTRAAEPAGANDDGGTSHLCVADSRAGAVSCTETINLTFGSLVAVPEFGFILNDQMDDFTTKRDQKNAFGLVQSPKNLPAPGKRPLSSMTPTIVLTNDGAVDAVVGASGGPRIITGTTQVLLSSYLLSLDAAQSVSRPRLHHQWMPNMLEMEENYPGTWNGLAVPLWMSKLHHQQRPGPPTDHACVQFIRKTDKGWDAACDPRKGGSPAGR